MDVSESLNEVLNVPDSLALIVPCSSAGPDSANLDALEALGLVPGCDSQCFLDVGAPGHEWTRLSTGPAAMHLEMNREICRVRTETASRLHTPKGLTAVCCPPEILRQVVAPSGVDCDTRAEQSPTLDDAALAEGIRHVGRKVRIEFGELGLVSSLCPDDERIVLIQSRALDPGLDLWALLQKRLVLGAVDHVVFTGNRYDIHGDSDGTVILYLRCD